MRSFYFIFVFTSLLLDFARSDGYNQISAPDADSTVIAEQPYTIEWEGGTPGPVNITLRWDDSPVATITFSTENNGSYTFIFSDSFAGLDRYDIKICDLEIEDECTYSRGYFDIQSDNSSSALTQTTSSTSTSATLTSATVTLTTPTSSSALTPTTSATPTPTTPASSSAPTPTTSATSTPGSSGLSVGAKAGIGIGCAFGVLIFILIGAYIVLWRPGRHAQVHTANGEHLMAETPVDPESNRQAQALSIDSKQMGSLGAVPSRNERHELPEFIEHR